MTRRMRMIQLRVISYQIKVELEKRLAHYDHDTTKLKATDSNDNDGFDRERTSNLMIANAYKNAINILDFNVSNVLGEPIVEHSHQYKVRTIQNPTRIAMENVNNKLDGLIKINSLRKHKDDNLEQFKNQEYIKGLNEAKTIITDISRAMIEQ